MGSHEEERSASKKHSSKEGKGSGRKLKKDRSSKKRKRDSVEDAQTAADSSGVGVEVDAGSRHKKRKGDMAKAKKSKKDKKESKAAKEKSKSKSKSKSGHRDKDKGDKKKEKKEKERKKKKEKKEKKKEASGVKSKSKDSSKPSPDTEPAADPSDDSNGNRDTAAEAATDKEVPADGLQRFPDFSQEHELSEESALQAARMGIPQWLAHPTTIDRDTTVPVDDTRFALSSHVLGRCSHAGIKSLFAVQSAVIPVLRAAHTLSRLRQHVRDLCVSAPTGSGKTLAYVLPIIEKLRGRLVVRLRALVVLPTKDLAHQVKECFDFFCAGTNLRVGLATGDMSLSKEQAALVASSSPLSGGSSRVDILVCTPGRLMDHLALTPNFSLQHLEFWVMDEADRLLGEAFQEWLPKIQASIETQITAGDGENTGISPIHDACTARDPKSRLDLMSRPAPRIQKLLFSATLTRDPAKIARLQLVRPLYISIVHEGDSGTSGASATYTFPSTLKELYATCPPADKPLWLIYVLWEQKINGGVCFTKSLEAAHRLAQVIQMWTSTVPAGSWPEEKIVVAEYSSDLPAAERSRIMRLFKRGKINLLICSDLIARGLDVDQIEAVINYDVPTHMSQYTHRVGRTARAGREGSAYSLVADSQVFHFKKMMKENGHWAGFFSRLSPQKAVLEMLRTQYEAALEKVSEIYS